MFVKKFYKGIDVAFNKVNNFCEISFKAYIFQLMINVPNIICGQKVIYESYDALGFKQKQIFLDILFNYQTTFKVQKRCQNKKNQAMIKTS